MAAVQVGITGVLPVDGHSRIAQHGLRPGGCQLQRLAGFLDRIQQVPEMSVLGLVLHLGIGNRGIAVRAPVYHAVAAVDQALFIQVDEHFFDGPAAALIQCEALTVPVAGGAQLFQLLNNAAAVFLLPGPGALQKFLAPDLLLGDSLFAHGLDNLGLRCDGSMVGSRQPQGGISLHPAETDQDILQRFIQRMAHVQLAGDVRRRNHNGVRFFLGIHFRVEIAALHPEIVDAALHFLRFVGFCQFFAHIVSLSFQVFAQPVFQENRFR